MYRALAQNIYRHNRPGNQFRGPIQALILDWSGTTVDAHVVAPAVVFVEVFKKHGVPITMKEAREPMGLRKDLHIQKILEIPEVKQRWTETKQKEPNAQDVEELFEDFVPMQLECLPQYTSFLPGVLDTLKVIDQDFDLKIGSTTGFTAPMVDMILQDTQKNGYSPDTTVAGDQVPNNLGFRPAPFMIYQNLFNLGIYPIQSVVKVDDTVSGVGEGLNAGCWSIGISGYSNYTEVDSIEHWDGMTEREQQQRRADSREKLFGSGAHYVIEEFTDLPTVLHDIEKRLGEGDTP